MTFFFYGVNDFLIQRRVDEMTTAYVAKTGSDMGVQRLSGATSKPDEIRSALQAAPFLASSRLVLITGLASMKSTFEKLGDVVGLVPKTTVAVFIDPSVDQRTTAFKHLLEADKAIEFEALTAGQLVLWVKQTIQSAGGTVGPGAAQELVRTAGDNQWRLAAEIHKLVAYHKTVTIETIGLLVVASPEQSIFALTDTMLEGRVADSLSVLRNLLQTQQNELGLLALLQGQLRNVLLAKAAGSISAHELAKATGIKPYPAEKAQTTAKRLNETAIQSAFILSVEAEQDIKTGRQKPDVALEMLLYHVGKLATIRR